MADYGRLARAVTEEGEGRIETVVGKRNAADFAIWRKTPAGETRQMEWDSPWGKGAPGWLSLRHISEPTRPYLIADAGLCLK